METRAFVEWAATSTDATSTAILDAATVGKPDQSASTAWPRPPHSPGSGNHFIEVSLDETAAVWLFPHSGSRGMGPKLAQHHIRRSSAATRGRPRRAGERSRNCRGNRRRSHQSTGCSGGNSRPQLGQRDVAEV
ncbi:RtcB family protein [Agromyces sp. GXS1127]|uniref:RtcB family protein n=1 Tax=Agromyces sp. GXS1127 TaxID=3424181 RepID=UPI003D320C87